MVMRAARRLFINPDQKRWKTQVSLLSLAGGELRTCSRGGDVLMALLIPSEDHPSGPGTLSAFAGFQGRDLT
jgi:hypothetical protein